MHSKPGRLVACSSDTSPENTVQYRESSRTITTDVRVEETSQMFEPEMDAPYQATEYLRIECVPETAEAVVLKVTGVGGSITSVQFELHSAVSRRLQNEAPLMKRAREMPNASRPPRVPLS